MIPACREQILPIPQPPTSELQTAPATSCWPLSGLAPRRQSPLRPQWVTNCRTTSKEPRLSISGCALINKPNRYTSNNLTRARVCSQLLRALARETIRTNIALNNWHARQGQILTRDHCDSDLNARSFREEDNGRCEQELPHHFYNCITKLCRQN